MTIGELRRQGRERLSAFHASQEADWMLQEILACDSKDLLLRNREKATKEQIETYSAWLQERETGKPLQYILGHWPFYGRDFLLREPVLIPREDSETVIEAASMAKEHFEQIIDLCCGSGILGLTMAAESGAALTAVDINPVALTLTEENADRLDIHVDVLQCDLLSQGAFDREEWQGRFDCLLCNPPYIQSAEITTLSESVRDFESLLALDGGDDGLLFYRQLADHAGKLMRNDGVAAFEIGLGQAEEVRSLFCENKGWTFEAAVLDGNERERALRFRWKVKEKQQEKGGMDSLC